MYDRTKVLSISSVQDGLTCLRQFQLKHVLQKPQIPVGEGARRGTIIHGLLENYSDFYQVILNEGGSGNFDTNISWQKMKKLTIKNANPTDHADLQELFEHVENRYNDPPILFPPTAKRVMAEKALTIDSNGILTLDDAKAVFGLKIDLAYLDGATITIRDYKSGKLLPEWKNPRKELMDDLQMRAYAGIVALNPDMFPGATKIIVEQDWLRFEYGRKWAKIPIDELASVWNEVVEWTEPIMIAQDKDDWPTTSGSHCSWCSARNHCPEWSQEKALAIRGDVDIADHESALTWAKRLRVIKGKVKEVDEAVRKYVEDNGPLRDGDEVLDFHSSSTSEVDLMEAVKILQEQGIDNKEILAACKMTKTNLDKFPKALNKQAKEKKDPTIKVRANKLKEALPNAINKIPKTKFGWKEKK